jgi:subtilisin family serine protease
MLLNRNFVIGRMLSAETHGTGVAGIIAAKANNRQGIVGVAPQARLLGLRACWQDENRSLCDSLSLAKALHFAIEKNVDVLNLSLTGPSGKLLTQLIAKAMANGAVVVAAVDSTEQGGGFPASSKGVVAVTDNMSIMSNTRGYRAPGNGVPTTQPNSKWFAVDGSSYSAAHVSGLFALLIEMRRVGNAQPLLIRAKDGSGKIDTRASLRKAAGS